MRRDFLNGMALGAGLAFVAVYTSHAHAAQGPLRSPQHIENVAEMLRAACPTTPSMEHVRARCVGAWVDHFFYLNGWTTRADARPAARLMYRQIIKEMDERA